MKHVLLIGSGGREHALGWKIAQSPQVSRITVAPGNDGMPDSWERWRLGDFEDLADRCLGKSGDPKIDLVVVGPDQPLADGLVDVLEDRGIPCFGPRRAAAQIEASKSFAKEVMIAAGVSTARHFVAENAGEALKILKSVPWPGWVVKVDGLALGKGVRVCEKFDEAREFVQASGPGTRFVIEELLRGQELSWMAFCDGSRAALLEPARDHKRLYDQDQGPNTGGMGAFSPVPGVPAAWSQRVLEEVFLPTLRELKKRGTPFRGLLYAGLMVDFAADKIWVLEFNSRFGDPEAQALLPRLDGDVMKWFEAASRGDLSQLPAQVPFVQDASVFVVAAAPGYPEQPQKGLEIGGVVVDSTLANPDYFFAGVSKQGKQWRTAGGRVLGALGMGPDLEVARAQAYAKLGKIHFEGIQFRRDIAQPPRTAP